jgi:predicted GNAT superfamily acetyltransferase
MIQVERVDQEFTDNTLDLWEEADSLFEYEHRSKLNDGKERRSCIYNLKMEQRSKASEKGK